MTREKMLVIESDVLQRSRSPSPADGGENGHRRRRASGAFPGRGHDEGERVMVADEGREPADGGGREGRSRDWTLETRETLYEGFYRIDRLRFRHALHGGGQSGSVARELFVRGDVVGVLPYDRASDSVLLIEQFRHGAMRQSPDPWLREIVAGMIDTDETPEAVARREAREEAGLAIERLVPISRYLTSPGASTEEVHLFLGECDLSNAGGRHGLADEDEDILACVVGAERAIGMLASREVRNGLSIIALQWLALYRAGLVAPESSG